MGFRDLKVSNLWFVQLYSKCRDGTDTQLYQEISPNAWLTYKPF